MKCTICRGVLGTSTLVGVMVAGLAGAQGLRNPPEGAVALGHVGGAVVLTEDASAVSHNPANLVDLKQAEVLPTLTVIHTETDFTGPAGTATTDSPWKMLPNVFAAYPINTRYVMGIGITTPYGQSMEWNPDGAFRYTAPYSAMLAVVNVNPTLAARLNDKVSVGVGLDAYWSRLEMKQRFPWSAMTRNPMTPDGSIVAKGDGEGIGANAAIDVKLTASQTLALTYRSPFRVDYEGDVDVSGMPAGAQALGLSPASDFDSSIDFPAVAALGYGLKLSDTVRVGVDVEWVQSSRYKTLELDGGADNALLNAPGAANPMAPVSIRQDWDDSWTAGFGVDWRALPDVTLRAGYIHLWSPVPDETLAPTLPDISRDVVKRRNRLPACAACVRSGLCLQHHPRPNCQLRSESRLRRDLRDQFAHRQRVIRLLVLRPWRPPLKR